MLPSMPILFTRESQDAFGNRILPSTSFFNQNSVAIPPTKPQPLPAAVLQPTKVAVRETKAKTPAKKKVQVNENPKIDNNALETELVRAYYTKVQSRFSSHLNLPSNKFVQFHSILKSFEPSKESPVDLYKKIKQLFGEEHKDIVEEFLLFLKPGQAAEVGCFMDHYMLVQMKEFIQLLQITFARKPTVLRKVLRALSNGVNSGSCEQMKARVLPHLRSNPRLSQMFRALFPNERPPDSLYENGTDVLSESFLTADRGYDVWEFEDPNDNTRKLEAKERLDTMYLNGRVFLQHGRILRSARVTYPYSKEPYRVHMRRLAHNHTHPSPPESDDERAKNQAKVSTKIPPKRTKKQLKSPTKTIKDVNDNTNKECIITSSPKTVKKPNSKNKCKDKKEENKSDVIQKKKEKDNKNIACKKDDSAKAKQTKIDTPVPVVDEKKADAKANWTRDEDKAMLQVLKGEAGSEEIFGKIRQMLPHRSVGDIKERFCHVMNLLQQMAVGDVT